MRARLSLLLELNNSDESSSLMLAIMKSWDWSVLSDALRWFDTNILARPSLQTPSTQRLGSMLRAALPTTVPNDVQSRVKTKGDFASIFKIVIANRYVSQLPLRRILFDPAICRLHPDPLTLKYLLICNKLVNPIHTDVCNFAKVARSIHIPTHLNTPCPPAEFCRCHQVWPECPSSDRIMGHIISVNYDTLPAQFPCLKHVLQEGAIFRLQASKEKAYEALQLAFDAYRQHYNGDADAKLQLERYCEVAFAECKRVIGLMHFPDTFTRGQLLRETRAFTTGQDSTSQTSTPVFVISSTDKVRQQLSITCAAFYKWRLSQELASPAYATPTLGALRIPQAYPSAQSATAQSTATSSMSTPDSPSRSAVSRHQACFAYPLVPTSTASLAPTSAVVSAATSRPVPAPYSSSTSRSIIPALRSSALAPSPGRSRLYSEPETRNAWLLRTRQARHACVRSRSSTDLDGCPGCEGCEQFQVEGDGRPVWAGRGRTLTSRVDSAASASPSSPEFNSEFAFLDSVVPFNPALAPTMSAPDSPSRSAVSRHQACFAYPLVPTSTASLAPTSAVVSAATSRPVPAPYSSSTSRSIIPALRSSALAPSPGRSRLYSEPETRNAWLLRTRQARHACVRSRSSTDLDGCPGCEGCEQFQVEGDGRPVWAGRGRTLTSRVDSAASASPSSPEFNSEFALLDSVVPFTPALAPTST